MIKLSKKQLECILWELHNKSSKKSLKRYKSIGDGGVKQINDFMIECIGFGLDETNKKYGDV